jgi:hypothetical protein
VSGPTAAQPEDQPLPSAIYPNLQAALEASAEGLFSEIPDPDARERLRRQYVRALREEDAVLREVQGALPER